MQCEKSSGGDRVFRVPGYGHLEYLVLGLSY
ncbi:hypothetical protein T12_3969 [Trichinella patagoniensis]|uniref:Uncharacterized protein n=1 Tax=Trichinella patagoniensis TaxID=990121 RepID=A0A0V0XFD2_9BILA|nr:hypothetical protein T12_3969 [Trichinella patagoniensis]